MTQPISACPIWGNGFEAKVFHIPQTNTIRVDDSPRAGGGYEIDYILLLAQVPSLSDKEKARLTTWLVDQRLQGNQQPTVTEEIISLAKNRRLLPVHERAEKLLRFIASSTETIADHVDLSRSSYESLLALAWSESTTRGDLVYLVDYLKATSWVQESPVSPQGRLELRATVAGYNRIAEAETNVDSSQAFVAMWFDPQMDEAYDKGIMPAIEDASYKPLRIDRKPDVNKIDDEIIAEIRRSKFIVADFTQGEDGARGAVYFEAGFASGLGLRVLYTCHKDKVNKLAFDTRQYTHILWETPEDLRVSLKNHIMAVFGEGPIKP